MEKLKHALQYNIFPGSVSDKSQLKNNKVFGYSQCVLFG